MTTNYRSVIIGCGARARAHLDAYQYIPNAKVMACCDLDAARAQEIATRYGLHAYTDAEEMIRQERPDLVHIVTNPDTRVALLTLVSDLGVSLCTTEKPVAMGVKDWRALSALAQNTGTKIAVCHQVRWQVNLVHCQQALQSGKLGNVLFLDLSAGMNIANQGTHILNYGMLLNGDMPVESVFANAHSWDNVDINHPGPVSTEAYLIFTNGVRGLWNTGTTAPKVGDPSTTWQHVRIAAYAERGRVLFEEFGKWEVVSPEGTESGDYGGMDTWMANNIKAQAAFHQVMLSWMVNETMEPGTSLNKSLHEWSVVLALYQSALERRPVKLSGFYPSEDLVERYRSMR